MPGLCESVQKWSGDVDLNSGELQQSYGAYKLRLKFVSEIGLKSRQERNMILEDLKTQLIADKDFAISGTRIHYSIYSMILRLGSFTHFVHVYSAGQC